MENSCCEFSAAVASYPSSCSYPAILRSERRGNVNGDRRHQSESAGDNVARLTVARGIEQKLLKLNHYGIWTRSARSPAWLRAHYPHLREDYPPAVALCASAASLSAREECGKQLPRILPGRPFACMPFSRPHDATYDTHNCPSLCPDVDTPLDSGQSHSQGEGIITAGEFRPCRI